MSAFGISKFTYRELQTLAKANGIAANQKKEKLVDALSSIGISPTTSELGSGSVSIKEDLRHLSVKITNEKGFPLVDFECRSVDERMHLEKKSRQRRKRRKEIGPIEGFEPFNEEKTSEEGDFHNIGQSPVKECDNLSCKRQKLEFFADTLQEREKEDLVVVKRNIHDIISLTGGRVLQYIEPGIAAFLVNECGVFSDNGPVWRYLLSMLVKTIPESIGSEMSYRKAFDRRYNEILFLPESDVPEKHRTLRRSFFPVLCNWLVELHFELFRDHERELMCHSALNPVHMSMKYLFRYLSTSPRITSNRLQLVGVSCYQIALNVAFGEVMTAYMGFDSKRCAYYTDNAYTADEVSNMTADIMRSLSINKSPYMPEGNPLSVFTPMEALRILLRTTGLESNHLVVLFANFAVDLIMHDTRCFRIMPSEIASAAVDFACKEALLDLPDDSKTKRLITEFCYQRNIKNISKAIKRIFKAAKKQETGRGLNRQLLPAYSMVIKHYSSKLISWTRGSFSTSYRKSLFK
mmetsp:Transcript_22598/g.45400  ORF Transcript_22598/g.45400 Transcript_22598/m.45400 type:complete len:521 (-) Transcript_22598:141-1703(-)